MTFSSYILSQNFKKIAELGDRLGEVEQLIDWEQFRPIIAGIYYDCEILHPGMPMFHMQLHHVLTTRHQPVIQKTASVSLSNAHKDGVAEGTATVTYDRCSPPLGRFGTNAPLHVVNLFSSDIPVFLSNWIIFQISLFELNFRKKIW